MTIMDINRENYTRSLENIRPSEKFLAETKKLMLEEASKAEKAAKPSRKPFMMKITPFAAAACIALIAVVGVNTLRDKGVETAQASESAYTETSEKDYEENIEAASVDEAEDEALSEEIAEDEAEITGADEVPEAEPSAGEPAFYAADMILDNGNADDSVPADETEMPASDEEYY